MSHYNLALLGFGNVGRALARLLLTKRAELQSRYNLTFAVTGIATGRHGAALNPDGLDLEQALAAEHLTALGTLPTPVDAFDFITRSGADVLFENSPVNYATGQPAADHLRAALEAGMHAITANKGPVVHAFAPLTALAHAKGVRFFFEASVMDGAPIFSLFRGGLPAAQLLAFEGILNSTTNLILGRMEAGDSFDQAVAYAQQIGIAETDPSGDVDGWDAAVKVAALVTVLMGHPLTPQQVDRRGIRALTAADIAAASAAGERWKLICRARRTPDGSLTASVAPERIAAASPLYQVSGTTSCVAFETDVLGKLTVIETDPGPATTAYGLLADFVNAVRPD
jgi:homoserine dehydrogenase